MYKKAKYIFEIIKLALENKKIPLIQCLSSPMYHCKIVMPYLI